MDNIISAIIGALSGGGLSWIFFFRANKSGANADAITKAATAMKELLNNIEQQQIVNNEIIKQKDNSISERDMLIQKYRESLEQNNQKIKELTFTVNEQQRKIEGMQKLLDKEMGNKKYAERLICVNEECRIRKPALGTYNTEGK